MPRAVPSPWSWVSMPWPGCPQLPGTAPSTTITAWHGESCPQKQSYPTPRVNQGIAVHAWAAAFREMSSLEVSKALSSHPTKAVQWIFTHPQRARHFQKAKRTKFVYNYLNPAIPAPSGYPTYPRRAAQGGSCSKVCHVLPKFAFDS